jgi:hypothetical protein
MKGDRERPMPTRELGFLLIFLGEHREPPPVREALARSLQIAVRNWRRGVGHEGPADYRYGEAALRRWSEDLGRADDLPEEDRKKLFFLTWLNFNTVADARRAAESFLQAHGPLLEGKARQALERAAALCKEEGRMLGGIIGRKDAFLGPWTGKKFGDWSDVVRRREIAALDDILRREEAAISDLERALAALGG